MRLHLCLGISIGVVFSATLSANEAMFVGAFSDIRAETGKAARKRAEITRNLELLAKLSEKNILLERAIGETVEEISRGVDFNMEALSIKTSGIQNDVSRSSSMQTGFKSINQEVESTWKTKK